MSGAAALSSSAAGEGVGSRVAPTLSVIVPVYNQGDSIVDNVREIHRRVAAGLDGEFELIVVSDGSIDRTVEALLESRIDGVRVLSYDRNLGKGYAVKTGVLAARGEWVAYVDADLDLDPAAIPRFLAEARRDRLDFAIGSKRHPDSRVDYPPSRVVASWLYQQLVRLLFRLEVRDTQVGLKVFRREVAQDVFPLLLVKRFAFDLELLAVANALGHGAIRELPVALDYKFTGSGVRSVAVLRALVDTAAIFYRLRILRYYERKRQLLGGEAYRRALDYRPLVTVISTRRDAPDALDYATVEFAEITIDAPSVRAEAAREAKGELLAFLGAGGRPAANWISSAVQFLSNPAISAVVCPSMAPHTGPLLERAAAALAESRIGGGSQYIASTPGNLRFVSYFSSANVIVRRGDLLGAVGDREEVEDVCAELEAAGKAILYTPETVVIRRKVPLFRPHLWRVSRYARGRGIALRRLGWRTLRPSTVALLLLYPTLAAGAAAAAFAGGGWRFTGIIPWAVFAGALGVAAAAASFRFRSLAVGALLVAGALSTHAVYLAAFWRGFARGR